MATREKLKVLHRKPGITRSKEFERKKLATHAVNVNGTPIHVLQQLMRHASITTTREFYTRITQDSEQEAAERYERLFVEPPIESRPETDVRLTPDGVGRYRK